MERDHSSVIGKLRSAYDCLKIKNLRSTNTLKKTGEELLKKKEEEELDRLYKITMEDLFHAP